MLERQPVSTAPLVEIPQDHKKTKEGIPLIKNAWEEISMSVALFTHVGKEEPTILVGPKTRGHCEGFLVEPGGKFAEPAPGEKRESDVECARREGQQESGLTGGSSMQVAEVRVNIIDQRLRLIVHIILFSDWTGTLKWNEEFEWLKFIPFSQIPKDKLPPGDEQWLQRVLIECKPTLARIHCGKNRKDLLSTSCEDLYGKQENGLKVLPACKS